MDLKPLRRTLWLGLLLAAVAGWQSSWAQGGKAAPERERLSPQQREQVKQTLRSRWQAMTPEERDAAKIKLKQRFQSLTPEQKETLLKRWQQRRADGKRE